MKVLRFTLLQLIACTMLLSVTQAQKGWRKGEMEVKINITDKQQYQQLDKFNFNGDVYPNGIARLYLVPEELKKIQEAGFSYEILEENLDKRIPIWMTKDDYHSYQEIIDLMDSLENAFPAICKKYVVGSSVEGRELSYLKISDNVTTDEAEPEVCLDGGFHGDEVGASENIIRFARDICKDYATNSSIAELIDGTEIFLYVMVNPDGRYNDVRYNANGVDLNRDWGYMWDGEGSSAGYYSQIENKVFRDFVLDNQFAVHVSYHSGIELIIYPWGFREDLSPDNAHVDQLANIYADESGYTNIGVGPICATLYSVNGGSIDGYYGIMGSCTHVVELSSNKHPSGSQIAYYYNINYNSMLAMVESAMDGLHGSIIDANTGEPVAATIFIDELFPVYSDPVVGDFHKYLIAGTYNARVVANGYETKLVNNIAVSADGTNIGNIELTPSNANAFAYKLISCQIPGNNTADDAITFNIIGENDNEFYSIGKDGVVIFEMQEQVYDKQGNDIKIHEGDATDESFSLYASETADGPWTFIGTGTGTTEFDLADGIVTKAKYFKLVDDGDGSSNVNGAGFDFDAAEQLPGEPGTYLIVNSYEISEVSGNGNGRIDPGETINFTVTLKNLGDAAANSTSGTLADNSNLVEVTNPNGNFGNLGLEEEGSETFEIVISESATAGTSFGLTLSVESNSGSYFNVYNFGLAIGLVYEDFESGDFESYPWTLSGQADWEIITGSNTYEGTYSAKSGNIVDGQASAMEINLNPSSVDTISFYYKVSSEQDYDYLKFYVDGNMQSQWSGEVDWQHHEFVIQPGNHTVKWEYSKDDYESNGSDCAWIDLIALPGVSGAVNEFSAGIVVNPNQCNNIPFQMVANASGGSGSYTYNWTPAAVLDNPTAMNPIATITENTTFTVEVSDGTETVTDAIDIVVNEVPETPTITLVTSEELHSNAPNGNQWYFYEQPIDGATEQNYQATEAGEYYTIVTNSFGCSSEPSNIIDVLIGVEKIQKTNISVMPNPSNGIVKIDIDTKFGLKEIRLFSLDGIEVLRKNDFEKKEEIILNIEEKSKGLYLMEIIGASKTISKKILLK